MSSVETTEPRTLRRPTITENRNAPVTPWELKPGVTAHILTAEERSRGGKTLQKRRAEAAKSVLVKLAEKTEERADEIIDAYLRAVRGGDWKAGEAMLSRVYGLPVARQVVAELPADVTWASMSQEQRQLVREQVLALRLERAGDDGGRLHVVSASASYYEVADAEAE